MSLRWTAYWLFWWTPIDLALDAAFFVAELLHDMGVDRIGKHLLIDTLLEIEGRVRAT
jgi:hypothetical protein